MLHATLPLLLAHSIIHSCRGAVRHSLNSVMTEGRATAAWEAALESQV